MDPSRTRTACIQATGAKEMGFSVMDAQLAAMTKKKKVSFPRIPVPKPTIIHKKREEKRAGRSVDRAKLRKEHGIG